MPRCPIPNRLVLIVLAVLLLGRIPHTQAAVVCDGVDDSLTTSTNLETFLTQPAGTMLVWFQASGTHTPSTCGDGSQDIMGDREIYFAITRSATNTWCGWLYEDSAHPLSATAAADTPHHAAVRFTGGVFSFFLDGALTTTSGFEVLTYQDHPLDLCRGTPYNIPAAGIVYAAQTYAGALTDAEIQAQASSHLLRSATMMPSGRWDFTTCGDGASGDAVSFPDLSGNAHPFVGDNGANNTGMGCVAASPIRHPAGIW